MPRGRVRCSARLGDAALGTQGPPPPTTDARPTAIDLGRITDGFRHRTLHRSPLTSDEPPTAIDLGRTTDGVRHRTLHRSTLTSDEPPTATDHGRATDGVRPRTHHRGPSTPDAPPRPTDSGHPTGEARPRPHDRRPLPPRRLTTKLSGPGHGPVSFDEGVRATRGRGPLQREVRRPATTRRHRNSLRPRFRAPAHVLTT